MTPALKEALAEVARLKDENLRFQGVVQDFLIAGAKAEAERDLMRSLYLKLLEQTLASRTKQ